MIVAEFSNRLEKTQKDMIRVLNKQIEGSDKEARYLLEDFNNEQLELIGRFVLSFYN